VPRTPKQADRDGIAYRMREWRERHQMTQADAAHMAGVQRAGWARWERAEVFPTNALPALEWLLTQTPPPMTDIDRIGRRAIRVKLSPQMRLFTPGTGRTAGRSRSSEIRRAS
jgi:DNA-binding XRE family transcriptional regulator